MQVICRTNIQTASGDIYGISTGATLYMWQSKLRLSETPRVPLGSLPITRAMVKVVTNIITRLRRPLGCQGNLLLAGFWVIGYVWRYLVSCQTPAVSLR